MFVILLKLFKIMVNLAPTAFDAFAESLTVLAESTAALTLSVSKNVPNNGNVAICGDCLCTTGRAGLSFYLSPNPIAKVFFGASCLCGVMGALSSGTALVTSFAGIPALGWVGSFGARGCNRVGKHALHMGNFTSGNITNTSAIVDFIS